ncbi:response regulator transcription factor [Streptomyces sp. S.PNR 29]|uniref:helix-turn-helix transcriptional regulator n=1 Tax=Streptomyces sp. S.PNR 29 TaxID=2973805 RepID=UPI0025B206EC|nr:response regulator transcription factor [Streptomyces sp. S.PNR 29]MDN0200481.1 response regulator transcription factor [Streptomyces sp. S.PNR 29]
MGVRSLLAQTPGIASVHDYAYEPHAAAAIDFADVDILLLSCPREEWARETAGRASAAGAKVLLLLDDRMASDPDSVRGVTAHGILLKHELTSDSLTLALAQVRTGGFPMPLAFSHALLKRPAASSVSHRERIAALTPRERETLLLLVEGLSNKLIARRLRISEHGVKRLVANILAKMNCPNRTQAAAIAVREHLVATPGAVASGQLTRGLDADPLRAG